MHMATMVNIHEAKTHLSKLVERVAAGEEIIIARAGKPIARLSPLNNGSAENARRAGWGKDLLKDVDIDALFDPALDKEIEDLFYNGPILPPEK
jgi:prevent-host-death family protein